MDLEPDSRTICKGQGGKEEKEAAPIILVSGSEDAAQDLKGFVIKETEQSSTSAAHTRVTIFAFHSVRSCC